MDLRPACVSRSLCLKLLLNIDEQADSFLLLRRPALCFSDRWIQEILSEIRFPISFRKRRQPDKALLVFAADGNVLPGLDLIAGFLQLLQEFLEILWCRRSLQDAVDILADQFPDTFLLRIIRVFLSFPVRLWGDDGESSFQADQIADALQGKGGEVEVPEFPCPVQ